MVNLRRQHEDGALEATIDRYFRRNFSVLYEPDLLVAIRRFIAKNRRASPYSVSVGTTAVQLLAADPNRIEASIYNLGNALVYLGNRQVIIGSAGAVNAGFPIQPSTGIVKTATTGELWAISGSAAQDVRVWDEISEV